ncbi:unnamed protein product, partial [Laminaria digitata]
EEEEEEEEQEVPHLDRATKKIVEKYERSFFARNRWSRECRTFVLPGQGFWLDAHGIQKIRKSTHEDFASATPRPMPVYIKPNPYAAVERMQEFRVLEDGYHLCKKVAVASDGRIFRATDSEIVAALAKCKNGPSTSAATYVKAVQEIRRRHDGSVQSASSPKRRRLHVIT